MLKGEVLLVRVVFPGLEEDSYLKLRSGFSA